LINEIRDSVVDVDPRRLVDEELVGELRWREWLEKQQIPCLTVEQLQQKIKTC
jgi:hypothetical protein